MKFAFLIALCLSLAAPAAAQPTTPPPQGENAGLQAELQRISEASGGVVGMAAIHLRTGAIVSFNGGERFKLASTVKVPLAAYALHLADQNRLALTDTVPIRRADMLEPGILHEYFPHDGLAVSWLNLIDLSVTVSDNGATEAIYTRVGGPRALSGWLAGHGVTDVTLVQTLKGTFSNEPGSPQPDTPTAIRETITPLAMVRFLRLLKEGRLLSPERTALLLGVMGRVQGGEGRIGGFLPPGVKVVHKTGTLVGADGVTTNDVGYVTLPGGDVVVIALFTRGVPSTTVPSARERVLANASRAVYDHFQLWPPRERPGRR
jgi:beta-lactamase class A